jgi:hypothetical protein
VSHRATGALCDKYINDEPARIGDGLPLVTAAVGIARPLASRLGPTRARGRACRQMAPVAAQPENGGRM